MIVLKLRGTLNVLIFLTVFLTVSAQELSAEESVIDGVIVALTRVVCFFNNLFAFVLPVLPECSANATAGIGERPVVTIYNGKIRGTRKIKVGQPSFLSFKGIPYAAAPINELRWRNTQPHANWSDTKDCARHGHICPVKPIFDFGITLDIGGIEDCLFLNVYTTKLEGSRPVMVFVHGGGFVAGSADDWSYGAGFLVNDGVVVVSFNYRLGSFGFLSTGDSAAQGNWGMKDQVQALKWVQQNINKFGGNPDDVTIFGESAGSVSVNYLVISPMAKGLFKKAISESGSCLVPWGHHYDPLPVAEGMGRTLGLTWKTNQELITQMRLVPWEEIRDAQRKFIQLAVPRAGLPFDFCPNTEPADSPEPMFMSQSPEQVLRSGNFTLVPIMIGTNNVESKFFATEPIIDPDIFKKFAEDESLFVPYSYGLNKTTQKAEIKEVADKFKAIYFNSELPSSKLMKEWLDFSTDGQFTFGVERTIRYYYNKSDTTPIYVYTFSFDGSANMVGKNFPGYKGACHTDELFYIFDPELWPELIVRDSAARLTTRRMVRMWSNFAKTGNPTPVMDEFIKVTWPKFTLATENYLNIGTELVPSQKRFNGRLDPWHAFIKRFNP